MLIELSILKRLFLVKLESGNHANVLLALPLLDLEQTLVKKELDFEKDLNEEDCFYTWAVQLSDAEATEGLHTRALVSTGSLWRDKLNESDLLCEVTNFEDALRLSAFLLEEFVKTWNKSQ